MNTVAFVDWPPGVVTTIGPLTAPTGTVAVTCVDEPTVKLVAAVPPNLTADAPDKFVPVITTDDPTTPDVGANDDTVGNGGGATVTVNTVAFVDWPPGVVTTIGPLTAPTGTVAVTCVDEPTVKLVAAVPPNLTADAPDKFVPVITTDDPTTPDVGANDDTVGNGGGATVTVNTVAFVDWPPGVVTTIGPLTAPTGTVAVTCVDEPTVKLVAAVPPNLTADAPDKFVPVITTDDPTTPDVGANDDTVGNGGGATVTVNTVAFVDWPPGVVTTIGPLTAPTGTVAVTCVDEPTVKLVAAVPPNLTADAPDKFVPVITTDDPTTPDVGANDDTVGNGGGAVTVNTVAFVDWPPGVVTTIGPLTAPTGTVAVTCVDEPTVKLVAAVPPNLTADAPDKFVPVITTDDPTTPDVGANDDTVGNGGGAVTVNTVAFVDWPPGVVTTIGPLTAPTGTVAVTCVDEPTVKLVAAVPPNLTADAPDKFVPVITTDDPTTPDVGANDDTVGNGGGAVTVNTVAFVDWPPGVVTTIGPLTAPTGTVAVTCVDEPTVKLVAAVPPNLTADAPDKFVPVITTDDPTTPDVGANDDTVGNGGGAVTVNTVAFVDWPPGVVTTIGPLTAPTGTVAVTCVDEPTVKLVAAVPPNLTADAPDKFVPVITTDDPTTPDVGANDDTVGNGGGAPVTTEASSA